MKSFSVVRKAALTTVALAAIAAMVSLAACAPASQGAKASGVSKECGWSAGYEVNGDGMVELDGNEVDVRTYCLTCHGENGSFAMTWSIVEKATADWHGEQGVNPHESHLGAMQCNLCHADGHTLEMYCDNCHEIGL